MGKILAVNNYKDVRMARYIILFVSLILVFSCTRYENKNETNHYLFRYYAGATGIDTFIVVNGKEHAIRYHENSTPHKLNSFLALKWNILNPNSEGKIYVVGKVLPEVKETPDSSDPGFITIKEQYQEFELHDWYITKPFYELRWKNDEPLGEREFIERLSLKSDDFNRFEGKEGYEFNAHVR